MKRPLILVTNDDGISAPGIRNLIRIMNDFGDVFVVAPDGPQSGMGHAITIEATIRCDKIVVDKGPQIEYSCSGTPVDCVKLAVNQLLSRKPDLCVSGINHGSNSSINVIYSGTMSAAVEGAIEKIPSIGFSLLDYSPDASFIIEYSPSDPVIWTDEPAALAILAPPPGFISTLCIAVPTGIVSSEFAKKQKQDKIKQQLDRLEEKIDKINN